jgi:type II secretory pathway component PulF
MIEFEERELLQSLSLQECHQSLDIEDGWNDPVQSRNIYGEISTVNFSMLTRSGLRLSEAVSFKARKKRRHREEAIVLEETDEITDVVEHVDLDNVERNAAVPSEEVAATLTRRR